ncbi:MAG: methyltransferase, partial [Arenibacterium sp.]
SGSYTPASEAGRAAGRGEETPLADWIGVAAKRLRAQGLFHLILRIERMPEVLSAALLHLGSLEILPLAARTGRAPDRFLLRGRKNGRATFKLWPALVLHEGSAHSGDRDSYTPAVNAVFGNASSLNWPSDHKD